MNKVSNSKERKTMVLYIYHYGASRFLCVAYLSCVTDMSLKHGKG